jgi:sterol desaturase/sphingolipid hydroxylase (fatty acid hydroxylase superfamily)
MSVIQKIFSRSFAYDYAEWSLGILPWALVSAFAAVALGTHASASHFLVDARVPESWSRALYLNFCAWCPAAIASWLLVQAAARLKWNKGHAPASLVVEEVARSVGGVVIATAWEMGVMRACTDEQPDASGPILHLLLRWQLLIMLWLDVHFYIIHRLEHESAFLYKHVHKVHHRSFNPNPFSGHSMHPVEQLLFFSSFALCLVLPMPYYVLRVLKLALLIGPLAEHLGAITGHRHYLHHKYFSFNYGSSLLFDILLETSFEDLPAAKRDRILGGMAQRQAELAGAKLEDKPVDKKQ